MTLTGTCQAWCTPAAILIGSVMISGSILWVGARADNTSVARDAATPDGSVETALRPVANAAIAPAASATATASLVGIVALDSFLQAWEREPAARAERECWTPIQRTGAFPVLPASPHFDIQVEADGTISGYQAVTEGFPNPPTALYDCVGKIILTMRFPPSGTRQSVRVQANRPASR